MKKHALLDLKNVVGYGEGIKHSHGESQGRDCVLVAVEKKVSLSELSSNDIIPSMIEGIETDVIEVGKLTTTDVMSQTTEKARPAKGGHSIGHKDITAGTFGLLVKDNTTNLAVILSNNHVLAKSNEAAIGDAIYQPGPLDGGTSADTIGSLLRFVPIKFNGETPPPKDPKDPVPPKPPTEDSSCIIARTVTKILNVTAKIFGSKTVMQAKTSRVATQNADNIVDAAIAAPLDRSFVTTGTKDIPNVTFTNVAKMGEAVFKNGRTTNSTTGNVVMINGTVNVNYGPDKIATFTNQVLTQPMSKGGDSGSTMYNSNNDLIGLLFAGSDKITIFSNISDVFTQLDISIL